MGVRKFVQWHWVILAIAVVVATVTSAALLVLRTMPPRSIAMATGPEGGAYYEIGKRYQAILSHSGVQLRLVSTSGALQNLALLRDPHSGVSVALLQGGITTEADSPEIESLGTVFYEPVWLFQRSELRSQGLEGLRGRKISVTAVLDGHGFAEQLFRLRLNDSGEACALHDWYREAPNRSWY